MTRFRPLAAAAAVLCLAVLVRAADDPSESGAFTLFKFEQAIGSERYQIRPDDTDADRYTLTSTFSFTDRGTGVLLNTSLQFQPPLTPTRFAIKGDTARLSTIDRQV